MRVCGISSWLPRACGIATYFGEQSSAIAKLGVSFDIVCHPDEGAHQGQAGIHPILEINQPGWPQQVAAAIAREIRPDLVHLQHEFGLYDTARYPNGTGIVELVQALRGCGLPVVVTYHSLTGAMSAGHREHYRQLIPLTSISVAHAGYQVERLEDNLGFIPANMSYVEHGAARIEADERERLRMVGRQMFGLDGGPVVMLNGFFADNKGHEYLVARWEKIFARLQDRSAVLVAVGGIRRPEQQSYYDNLVQMVAASNCNGSVKLVSKIFTPEGFLASLAAADLLVAPYKHASQSGVLAHSAAVGTPVLARDLEGLGAFAKDARQGVIPFTPDTEADMDRMAEEVVALINDCARLQQMRQDIIRYVDEVIAWDKVAERYHHIYQQALQQPRPS